MTESPTGLEVVYRAVNCSFPLLNGVHLDSGFLLLNALAAVLETQKAADKVLEHWARLEQARKSVSKKAEN
jgi:hypothetical protein